VKKYGDKTLASSFRGNPGSFATERFPKATARRGASGRVLADKGIIDEVDKITRCDAGEVFWKLDQAIGLG